MYGHTRQFYRRLRESVPVWHLLNLPSRISYVMGRRELASRERALVRDLATSGIAVAHISELFPPSVFADLQSYVRDRLASPEVRAGLEREVRSPDVQSKRKESFLINLWGGEHLLDPEHPFLRFSLSRPMLAVVSAYLGALPKFREFFLQETVPIPPGTAAYSSQRWHADPDDRKLVKVFLYLNDVGETAGPFTYIRYSHGRGKWRSMFPYAPKRKSRHPDPAFIDGHIPPEDRVVAIGQAGTIIFCDTSGVHRGGYATGQPRIMYTSVYTTRASALPTRYTLAPNILERGPLPKEARYAITS